MAFYIRSRSVGSSISSGSWVQPTEIGIDHFLPPGVGFEMLPAIRKIPEAFLSGFAECNAKGIGLVGIVGGRIVHVFSRDEGRKGSMVKRCAIQGVGEGRVRNEGIKVTGQNSCRCPGVASIHVRRA